MIPAGLTPPAEVNNSAITGIGKLHNLLEGGLMQLVIAAAKRLCQQAEIRKDVIDQ